MGTERDRSSRDDRSTAPLLLVVAVVAIAPFLQFVAANRFEALDRVPVLVLGAVFAALATVATAIVSRRAGAVPTAAGAVVLLLMLFAFRPFADRMAPAGALLAWAAVTGGAVFLAVRVAQRVAAAKTFLLVLGALLAVMSVLPFVVSGAPASTASTAFDTTPFVTTTASDERPNVYLFLLDAYARADQLEAKLGYDNTPTMDALATRGFDVADDATAAYLFTPASVTSLFQADYPIRTVEELQLGLDRFGPAMTGHNRTVSTFEALGYEYFYAEPGVFAPMACQPAAHVHCLPVNANRPALGDAGVLIGKSTPFGVLSAFDPPHDLPDPLDVTDLVLADPTPGPRFLYAHILEPHNPFRYRADCSVLDEPIDILGPRSGALGAAYADQLTCLNRQLLDALDAIIEADPTAIIAVVSDHGDWFTEEFPGPDAPADVLAERFGILTALRAPSCPDLEAPSLLTQVMPTIFSCLSGEEVPLPDEHRYYVDYDGRFAEVDEQLRRRP